MSVLGGDESQFVSMNMAGRFNGQEIKRYGQQVIKHILTEKEIGLFFGQQTNFRPALNKYFEYIGNTRAFLVYNKKQFKVCDEKQYRHHLRDLELQGRMPRHYLPETNFVVCKVKTRSHNKPRAEFIAVSWLTDECMGKLRASSQLKKVLAFIENISMLEQLPVIVGGTFRLTLEDAKELMTPGFRCCGYLPANKRREVRTSSFYICSRSLKLHEVKPIVCSKIDLAENDKSERWLNPEDAFYWDPVIANFVRGYESRAVSPDLLTPLPPPPTLTLPPTTEVVTEIVREIVPMGSMNGQHNGNAPQVVVEKSASALSLAAAADADDLDGEIRRIPSYVELYDEELMESNAVCYMQ